MLAAIRSYPPCKQRLPPPYNPYPFGILPSDLNSEIERVRREAAFIEQEAIAEWQALPPLMLTVNRQPSGVGRGRLALEDEMSERPRSVHE